MTTLRESLATLRSDMRSQLSELRGELEREKKERMILEKEVMKECFDGNIIVCHDSAKFSRHSFDANMFSRSQP